MNLFDDRPFGTEHLAVHDCAREIAGILCPLFRAYSPEVAARLLPVGAKRIELVLAVAKASGVRRSFWISEERFIVRMITEAETNFVGLASSIELVRKREGKNIGTWTGKGQWQTTPTQNVIEMAGILGEDPVARALVEIDISYLYPSLERLLQQWVPPP